MNFFIIPDNITWFLVIVEAKPYTVIVIEISETFTIHKSYLNPLPPK